MNSPGETCSLQGQELSLEFCLMRAFLGLSFNESSNRPALLFPQVQPNAKRTWRKQKQISEVAEPQFSSAEISNNKIFPFFFFFLHHSHSTIPQEVSRTSCSKAEWNTTQIISLIISQYHCFEPLKEHYTPGYTNIFLKTRGKINWKYKAWRTTLVPHFHMTLVLHSKIECLPSAAAKYWLKTWRK